MFTSLITFLIFVSTNNSFLIRNCYFRKMKQNAIKIQRKILRQCIGRVRLNPRESEGKDSL